MKKHEEMLNLTEHDISWLIYFSSTELYNPAYSQRAVRSVVIPRTGPEHSAVTSRKGNPHRHQPRLLGTVNKHRLTGS